MICKLHASNGVVESCPSCAAGSPPDIGLNIADGVQSEDRMGGLPDKETNPEVLRLWISQAYDVEHAKLILMYIALNHPNADAKLVGELLHERLANQGK